MKYIIFFREVAMLFCFFRKESSSIFKTWLFCSISYQETHASDEEKWILNFLYLFCDILGAIRQRPVESAPKAAGSWPQ